MDMDIHKLWTRKDAAHLLGVSQTTFRYHLRRHHLGCQDHPHRQRCLTAQDILAAAKFFGVEIDRDKLMES
jgi:hypothetical protein